MSLALHGHLDTVTAPQLEKVLTEETEGVKMLIFDMKGLEYISSAGLRTLLAASKRMKAEGGSMVVRHANKDVMEVFTITGFTDILTIEE